MFISESSISIYDNIEKSSHYIFRESIKISVKFDFYPIVNIDFGDKTEEPYTVLIREANGNVIFSSVITTGYFCNAFQRWVSDIDILVYNRDGKLVRHFNLYERIKNGNVVISVDSSSLGDTISWVPYITRFIKEKKCKNAIVTTFWNNIFENQYDGISFNHPGYRHQNTDVVIGIGWYHEDDLNMHKVDPRLVPLQKVAADILGMDYIGEIRPNIIKTSYNRPTDKKYVCVGTESTAGAKHWNRPDGWQKLVDMLKILGYEVVVIQKQPTYLVNVIDKTGDLSIEDRISDILNCEFFIGVSSGLSWLSWGLNKPVVMISGFTLPFCEFSDKTLRIINTEVCNGCFNKVENKFDRGDWWWCPVNKGTNKHFECTKSISPSSVISKIISWEYFQDLS